MGKTKNSLQDSVKYLSIVRENKENARRQKLGKIITPVKTESDEVMLTFQSGNITVIKNIPESEFANEIIQILKLEHENRIKSYWIK